MDIKQIKSVQCYGEECALTCEVVISQSKKRYKTIMLEFCEIIDCTNKVYDRENKKQFMLTQEELFYFVAFSFRKEPKCEFNGHDNNTKQVVIHRKQNGLLFLLNWGEDIRLKCLMKFPVLFELINISILALQMNQPCMSTIQITETIKSMYIK